MRLKRPDNILGASINSYPSSCNSKSLLHPKLNSDIARSAPTEMTASLGLFTSQFPGLPIVPRQLLTVDTAFHRELLQKSIRPSCRL
jgi:hypothetical protein